MADSDSNYSSDDEKFFDAIDKAKSTKSLNLPLTSGSTSENESRKQLNETISPIEQQMAERRRRQIEKFKPYQDKLVVRHTAVSLPQEDFDGLVLQAADNTDNASLVQQALYNKKCRDDLHEMRQLNRINSILEDASVGLSVLNDALLSENAVRTSRPGSFTLKRQTNNHVNSKYSTCSFLSSVAAAACSNVTGVCATMATPSGAICIEANNDMKCRTWPTTASNLLNSMSSETNEPFLDSIEESVVLKTALKIETSEVRRELADSDVESADSVNVGNSEQSQEASIVPDEYINPVDKQIAAIFQMTSSSLLSADHRHSHGSRHRVNSMNSRRSPASDDSDTEDEEELLDVVNDEDSMHAGKDNDDDKIKMHHDTGPEGTNGNGYPVSAKTSKKTKHARSHVEKHDALNIQEKTKKSLHRIFRKFGKAVKQVQTKAEEVLNQDNDTDSDSDDAVINEAEKTVKYKAARANKSSHEFDKTQIVQILNSNTTTPPSAPGPPTAMATSSSSAQAQFTPVPTTSNSIIWAMKFSPCGKLLASAGKDRLIRIWVLRPFFHYFKDLMKHFNEPGESLNTSFPKANVTVNTALGLTEEQAPFFSKPFIVYHGHTADILDLSWSKNLFIISGSSDKTCRLWHIYKEECLCSFNHSSIVSAISFHPKDDRYFISACLDSKLRLWNIAEKKVVMWNECGASLDPSQSSSNFITAVSFTHGGKMIAVGTFDGKCILYHTEHLKYYSLINVRSSRGRNSKGSKITGIEVLNNDENKILITSNDSRIRLYDLRDLSLVCKYKGFSNSTVHIKASLSPDDRFIVSGSKNKFTYFWKTNYQFSLLTSGRRDRNMYWERIQAHNAIVTCALFAPKPQLILDNIYNKASNKSNKSPHNAHVLVSAAGCDGMIKVFVNKLDMSAL